MKTYWVFVAAATLSMTVTQVVRASSAPPPEPWSPATSRSALELGKQQLEQVRREAQLPRYGRCWTRALTALENGCGALDDDVQSRLALGFANCLLEKAGKKTYECQETDSIAYCLEGVDHDAYTTFANFFTHTQNMCYFLQSQIWQEATRGTIVDLSSTANRVASMVSVSAKVQEEIVGQQQRTLEYQRQLAANGSLLSRAIELSKANVKELMAEFKSSTDEQRALIFEIFDRVSRLQNLVMSEVSWIYTVIFYATSLLAVYLLTATRRTAEARLMLYLVLTLNFVLERLVCNLSLPTDSFEADVDNLAEIIYYRVWIVRKMAFFICFCYTGYVAYQFVDFNRVNNRLLEDIRRQNAEIKREMHSMQVSWRDDQLSPRKSNFDFTDGMKDLDAATGEYSDPGLRADDSDSSDDDTLSFNSTQTDRTWLMNEGAAEEVESDCASDESDCEDFYSTRAESREVSPAPQSVLSESGHLRIDDMVMPAGRYFLRERTRVTAKEGNPLLSTESPDSFGRLVSHMARVTKRNTRKLRMAMKKENEVKQSFYSSDEN